MIWIEVMVVVYVYLGGVFFHQWVMGEAIYHLALHGKVGIRKWKLVVIFLWSIIWPVGLIAEAAAIRRIEGLMELRQAVKKIEEEYVGKGKGEGS